MFMIRPSFLINIFCWKELISVGSIIYGLQKAYSKPLRFCKTGVKVFLGSFPFDRKRYVQR